MSAYRVSDIEVNDSVVLPPFGVRAHHGEGRRVLAIEKHPAEGYAYLTLDGLAPRTVPLDLEIRIHARAEPRVIDGEKPKRSPTHSRDKRDWHKHGVFPLTNVRRSLR